MTLTEATHISVLQALPTGRPACLRPFEGPYYISWYCAPSQTQVWHFICCAALNRQISKEEEEEEVPASHRSSEWAGEMRVFVFSQKAQKLISQSSVSGGSLLLPQAQLSMLTNGSDFSASPKIYYWEGEKASVLGFNSECTPSSGLWHSGGRTSFSIIISFVCRKCSINHKTEAF